MGGSLLCILWRVCRERRWQGPVPATLRCLCGGYEVLSLLACTRGVREPLQRRRKSDLFGFSLRACPMRAWWRWLLGLLSPLPAIYWECLGQRGLCARACDMCRRARGQGVEVV